MRARPPQDIELLPKSSRCLGLVARSPGPPLSRQDAGSRETSPWTLILRLHLHLVLRYVHPCSYRTTPETHQTRQAVTTPRRLLILRSSCWVYRASFEKGKSEQLQTKHDRLVPARHRPILAPNRKTLLPQFRARTEISESRPIGRPIPAFESEPSGGNRDSDQGALG